jgi:hypothetical protein
MERKPKWIKAVRIDREAAFEIKAGPERIFPLLCPVREYDWIPDWSCEMLYSKSGVAERDAIFATRMMPGRKALWCCVAYEPPRLVEYVFSVGLGGIVRLSISLDEAIPGSTRVTWAMRFTMRPLMARLTAKVTSAEGYAAMIDGRRRLLEDYLEGRP